MSPIHQIPEILVAGATRLTDVTVEMLFSEVSQQVIIVKVTLVTELAQRMTFVRAVVFVTKTLMMAKLCPTV